MKRAFFLTTQGLLVLTAVGKLAGAIGWVAGQAAKDPVVHFVSAREMLVVAALLELLAVAGIWRGGSDTQKAFWPLWLGLLFTGYRLELWHIGFTGYCSCFGSWSTWMHLSKQQVNIAAKLMIAFMLLGSLMIILKSAEMRGKMSIQLGRVFCILLVPFLGVFLWAFAGSTSRVTPGAELRPLPSGILAFNTESNEAIVTEAEAEAHFTFNFTNISRKDVTIIALRTSCGCTTVKLLPLPWTVAPHKTGEIPVVMNIKGQAGRIPKSVTLTTLQGTKELSVVAVILTASTNLHTDEREQNQVGLWATSGDSATIDTGW